MYLFIKTTRSSQYKKFLKDLQHSLKTKSIMSWQHKWAIHGIMTIAWETFNNIKNRQYIYLLQLNGGTYS